MRTPGVTKTTIVRRIWNGSTEPYLPNPRSELSVPAYGWACSMTKSRSQELSEKAAAERRRCSDWLIPFMQNGQPKFLTKDELRVAAMHQLNVSKSSFDLSIRRAAPTGIVVAGSVVLCAGSQPPSWPSVLQLDRLAPKPALVDGKPRRSRGVPTTGTVTARLDGISQRPRLLHSRSRIGRARDGSTAGRC